MSSSLLVTIITEDVLRLVSHVHEWESGNGLLHIFLRGGVVSQILGRHMEHGQVLAVEGKECLLDDGHDLVATLRDEAVVVGAGHVHGKLEQVLAGWDGLRDSTNLGNHNHSLDLLLVDVVECLVCDHKSTLLSPLKHIGLLDHVSIEESVVSNEGHQGSILLEVDVVFLLDISANSLHHFDCLLVWSPTLFR